MWFLNDRPLVYSKTQQKYPFLELFLFNTELLHATLHSLFGICRSYFTKCSNTRENKQPNLCPQPKLYFMISGSGFQHSFGLMSRHYMMEILILDYFQLHEGKQSAFPGLQELSHVLLQCSPATLLPARSSAGSAHWRSRWALHLTSPLLP